MSQLAGASMSRRVCLAAIGAALAGGCGGGILAPPEVPASFPAAPLTAVDSTSGQLHVELRAAPEPLVRGQNVGQLVVTDSSGQPVEGLTMTLVPWMTTHGHGTSVPPAITALADGVFIANPLYLFMAGQWELRMTFEGVVNDTATAVVAIP